MLRVLIRGGGDLATGVALRLHRAGIAVLVTELPHPLAVRRSVSLCEAVLEGTWCVEELTARRVDSLADASALAATGVVPVVVAPDLPRPCPIALDALVDARLTKRPGGTSLADAHLVIGLGPGFVAGHDCHAVVETMRGHTLGRVYWSGAARADTGLPHGDPRRVLRAPATGVVTTHADIGQVLEAGQLVATVHGVEVRSPFAGLLRGLIRSGAHVAEATKIGDVDSSTDPSRCLLVSDKALAIGGGVLEALLTPPAVRLRLAR
jgi:xanthine dehydrogenase accessory factor